MYLCTFWPYTCVLGDVWAEELDVVEQIVVGQIALDVVLDVDSLEHVGRGEVLDLCFKTFYDESTER